MADYGDIVPPKDSADDITIAAAAILSQVPATAWRPVIPHLVSLLATSPSTLVQKLASVALQSALSADPASVLLPVLAELHRIGNTTKDNPNSAAASSDGTASSRILSSSSTLPARLHEFVNEARLLQPGLCNELTQFMDAMKEADLEDLRKEAAKLAEAGKVNVDFNPVATLKSDLTSALEGKKDTSGDSAEDAAIAASLREDPDGVFLPTKPSESAALEVPQPEPAPEASFPQIGEHAVHVAESDSVSESVPASAPAPAPITANADTKTEGKKEGAA